MLEAFAIVAQQTHELLRQHAVVVNKARAVGLLTEAVGGVHVLRRLSMAETVCTTDIQTHRALVSCFFAAHFGRGHLVPAPFLEVLEILAQAAPCLICPTSLYFSDGIAQKLKGEPRATYLNMARHMVEDESFEINLLEAVRLLPQLQKHGGARSSALIDELHVITEAYRKAQADWGEGS
jgi:hypothetical protein